MSDDQKVSKPALDIKGAAIRLKPVVTHTPIL